MSSSGALEAGGLREHKYVLTSLIAYIGSGQSGHYYAFRKKNKEARKWFYVSDKCKC